MPIIMLCGDHESSGEWEEVSITTEDLAEKVRSGEWYPCSICEYDDNLPTYHRKEHGAQLNDKTDKLIRDLYNICESEYPEGQWDMDYPAIREAQAYLQEKGLITVEKPRRCRIIHKGDPECT